MPVRSREAKAISEKRRFAEKAISASRWFELTAGKAAWRDSFRGSSDTSPHAPPSLSEALPNSWHSQNLPSNGARQSRSTREQTSRVPARRVSPEQRLGFAPASTRHAD